MPVYLCLGERDNDCGMVAGYVWDLVFEWADRELYAKVVHCLSPVESRTVRFICGENKVIGCEFREVFLDFLKCGRRFDFFLDLLVELGGGFGQRADERECKDFRELTQSIVSIVVVSTGNQRYEARVGFPVYETLSVVSC